MEVEAPPPTLQPEAEAEAEAGGGKYFICHYFFPNLHFTIKHHSHPILLLLLG